MLITEHSYGGRVSQGLMPHRNSSGYFASVYTKMDVQTDDVSLVNRAISHLRRMDVI